MTEQQSPYNRVIPHPCAGSRPDEGKRVDLERPEVYGERHTEVQPNQIKDHYEKEPPTYFHEPCDTCVHRLKEIEGAPCQECVHYAQ
jgi:hypothetical protein